MQGTLVFFYFKIDEWFLVGMKGGKTGLKPVLQKKSPPVGRDLAC